MFRILFLMLLLLAGLILGPYIEGKQGFVLISTEHYNIEMSIVTLVVFFVITLAVVYIIEAIISRFFKLSSGLYNWFSNHKRTVAEKRTVEGFMSLQEGNYSKAEKMMSKHAKHAPSPILNYIKAAEAAQASGNELRANKFLIEATEIAGTNNVAVEVARIKIQLQQNKLKEARLSAEHLIEIAPTNSEAVKLMANIYLQLEAYQELDDMINSIDKYSNYTEKKLYEIKDKAEIGIENKILTEKGVSSLLEWWKSQPRKRRNNPQSIITFATILLKANQQLTAGTIITANINKMHGENLHRLLEQVAILKTTDNQKLIKALLKHKTINSISENNIYFDRALANLYFRSNELANAKIYIEKVLTSKQATHTDHMMAIYIFEQLGESDKAKLIHSNHTEDLLHLKEDLLIQELSTPIEQKESVLLEEKKQEEPESETQDGSPKQLVKAQIDNSNETHVPSGINNQELSQDGKVENILTPQKEGKGKLKSLFKREK